MAITVYWYGKALANAFGSTSAGGAPNIDYLSDDIRFFLLTNTYVPNQDTHEFVSDLTNEVGSGNGYTAGGVALDNKTLTYDTTLNTLRFDADDIAFTGGITCRYIAFADKTPATDATRPLLWYIDLGSSQEITGVTFSDNGIATIVAA